MQLITLIIIVNWSVWWLCTVKVAPKFKLFFLLRLYYFICFMAESVSHDPPHTHTTPPPHLLSLKRSNVLQWHLIWTANLEPKTSIDYSKNVVFNVWIRPPILDNLHSLHPPIPEEAPRTSRWGVNCRDAHAYLQLSDINIRFATKKIKYLYFTLVCLL